jgi:hypothetical protein
MGHNSGRSAVPGPVVAPLVAATAARLADRHPGVEGTVVHAVVYQAAVELAGTTADPDRLGQLLQRRADARLMALTGAPVPISSARLVPER